MHICMFRDNVKQTFGTSTAYSTIGHTCDETKNPADIITKAHVTLLRKKIIALAVLWSSIHIHIIPAAMNSDRQRTGIYKYMYICIHTGFMRSHVEIPLCFFFFFLPDYTSRIMGTYQLFAFAKTCRFCYLLYLISFNIAFLQIIPFKRFPI